MVYERIILIILDGFGIGAQPDAADFGDAGADTFAHLLKTIPKLDLPNLYGLGLAKTAGVKSGVSIDVIGAYGKMRQISSGKDTLTGHWEMMGVDLKTPFKCYPEGFSQELISEIEEQIGRKVIGNKVASGTKIIEELGAEHLETGSIILYTSADSVLQLAAHEEIIPISELYRICTIVRAIMVVENQIGRVIARPFLGETGGFYRTVRRRDFTLAPSEVTVLDCLVAAGYQVETIGKVAEIFANRGISKCIKAANNDEVVNKIIESMATKWRGLVFANLNDFDTIYGHRRDAAGYARALMRFDVQLSAIIDKMSTSDLLIITADHGNDPTFAGSDHTREYVPLLAYSKELRRAINLGERTSFADIGATIAENFGLTEPRIGTSFLSETIL
jgi:phosphopentomutase